MKYAWAVPGAKVVCIRGALRNAIGGSGPITGGVYTVTGFFKGPQWDQIYLEELPSLPEFRHPTGELVGWDIRRFRPLITRTQSHDIALFKRIADAAPADLEPAE